MTCPTAFGRADTQPGAVTNRYPTMFSMSARARAKTLARVTALMPTGHPAPVTVVRGTANAAWTKRAAIMATAFAALFVVALAGGRVVIPGGLAVGYFVRQVRPTFFLAPSPLGVHLSRPSFLGGRPTTIEATLPPAYFAPTGGKGTVSWGDRTLTLGTKEYRELVAATAGLASAAFPPPPPTAPPYAVPAPGQPTIW